MCTFIEHFSLAVDTTPVYYTFPMRSASCCKRHTTSGDVVFQQHPLTCSGNNGSEQVPSGRKMCLPPNRWQQRLLQSIPTCLHLSTTARMSRHTPALPSLLQECISTKSLVKITHFPVLYNNNRPVTETDRHYLAFTKVNRNRLITLLGTMPISSKLSVFRFSRNLTAQYNGLTFILSHQVTLPGLHHCVCS